jgi:hypothetical protein
MTGGRRAMKSTLKTILAVAGIIALSAASKHVAVLQLAEQVLTRNRNVLLAFLIPVAALGFMVFMGGCLLMLYEKGKPMSHTEVEEQGRINRNLRAAPYVARGSSYRIFGKAEGRQFSEELPLRDFKLAWQSGSWRHDATWRKRFVLFGGGLMMVFAGLAAVAVEAPIALSLVCAAFLIYGAVRLIWALRHA